MHDIDISEWLELWCSENINATVPITEKSEMRDLARDCAAKAEQLEITIAELKEAAGGDLENYLMNFQNQLAATAGGISDDQFVKQGLGIRGILQSVEDGLISAGFDDYVVVTERGSFHWQTAESARSGVSKKQAD